MEQPGITTNTDDIPNIPPMSNTLKNGFIIGLLLIVGLAFFGKEKQEAEFSQGPYTFSYTTSGVIALNSSTTITFPKSLNYTPANVVYSINSIGLNLILAITAKTPTSVTFNNMVAIPLGTQITFTCEPPNNL